MMAGAERGDVDGMVLWDPVVNGRAYVEEISALHQEMLQYAHVKPKRPPNAGKRSEILGFPITGSMLTGLERINLLEIYEKPADNILLIESHEKAKQELLGEYLKEMGAKVTYQRVPNPQLWNWIEDVDKVLVPHHTLQAIASWIAE